MEPSYPGAQRERVHVTKKTLSKKFALLADLYLTARPFRRWTEGLVPVFEILVILSKTLTFQSRKQKHPPLITKSCEVFVDRTDDSDNDTPPLHHIVIGGIVTVSVLIMRKLFMLFSLVICARIHPHLFLFSRQKRLQTATKKLAGRLFPVRLPETRG